MRGATLISVSNGQGKPVGRLQRYLEVFFSRFGIVEIQLDPAIPVDSNIGIHARSYAVIFGMAITGNTYSPPPTLAGRFP